MIPTYNNLVCRVGGFVFVHTIRFTVETGNPRYPLQYFHRRITAYALISDFAAVWMSGTYIRHVDAHF